MKRLNQLIESNQHYINKGRGCLCDDSQETLIELRDFIDEITKELSGIHDYDLTQFEANLLKKIKNL